MKRGKMIIVPLLWMLAMLLLLSPAGCDSEASEEDTVEDVTPDPVEEEVIGEDPVDDPVEEPVEDLPPELPPDMPSEMPEGPENCPPPPYGTAEGDTLEPHTFISVDDTLLSLCDLSADPSLKLLVIFATAGW
ncbi:MAG: hypothetical protein ABIJ56_13825 [Pseudomonadota bacterium]